MAYNTLDEAKLYLNLGETDTEDNELLTFLIQAVTEFINIYCGAELDYNENTAPKRLKLAANYLTNHFYLNRNMIAFAKPENMPFTTKALLSSFKKDWVF